MELAEFDAMFEAALAKVAEYVASQPDEITRQAMDFQLRHHMVINRKSLFHWANQPGHGILACCKCGVLTTSSYREPIGSRMRANQMCFHCDYWMAVVAEHSKSPKLIIAGHTYKIGTNPKGGKYNGMGGRKFDIELADGTVVTTYDLWAGSQIPAEHRAAMPDNAKFLGGAGFSGNAWNSSI
jgi:hypothetical protein